MFINGHLVKVAIGLNTQWYWACLLDIISFKWKSPSHSETPMHWLITNYASMLCANNNNKNISRLAKVACCFARIKFAMWKSNLSHCKKTLFIIILNKNHYVYIIVVDNLSKDNLYFFLVLQIMLLQIHWWLEWPI